MAVPMPVKACRVWFVSMPELELGLTANPQRNPNSQRNPIKPNAEMAEAVAEGEGTGRGAQHETRVRVRDVLARSAQLALQARVLIAGIHGQGPSAFATVNKDAASFDPQTAADREAELVLVQGLRASFPGIRIVGEEHEAGLGAAEAEDADDADDEGDAVQDDKDEIASRSFAAPNIDFASLLAAQNDSLSDEDAEVDLGRVIVFVDPLDGTRSFISGALKYVTTLVGIAVDGTPVGGIICSVFGGSMLLGGSCVGGVFLHEDATPNALKAIPTECANPRKVVVSKSRSKGLVLESLEQLASLGLVDNAWVHASGAGFKFAMVVRGEVGVYSFPRAGTCRWDTCAGTALILAQGGAVLNRLGEPIIYEGGKLKNDEGFVATRDPALSTKICQHLAAHGIAAATTPCP